MLGYLPVWLKTAIALAKTALFSRLIFLWAACCLTAIWAASFAAVRPCWSEVCLARPAAATAAASWLTWSPFSVCSCCMMAARPSRFCGLLLVSIASVVSSPPVM